MSTVAPTKAAVEHGAEVAFLQESYVGKKYTIDHLGLQIRWPERLKKKKVALAIRNDALDRYVLKERTDLIDSPHFVMPESLEDSAL